MKADLRQRSLFWDRVLIGGPAVALMPGFFTELIDYVSIDVIGNPGVLQKINPMATRTSIGCIRSCKFCAVPVIEGKLVELSEWPDLPIICDNNLLACSKLHFDKVINRLLKHNDVDFNQGIDARLLTKYHAKRLSEIKGLKQRGIRMALDNMTYSEMWKTAFDRLRSAGIPKRKISSYALIGFDSDPLEAWARCKWIESHGIKAFPMWYHPLDILQRNQITNNQKRHGWNDTERKNIFQWYYQHNNKYGGPPKTEIAKGKK